MVVRKKKQKDEIRICMDLKKLNDTCVHDPFPTLFIDEVLVGIVRQVLSLMANHTDDKL